jgi:molybdate transport system substrate-binding protein
MSVRKWVSSFFFLGDEAKPVPTKLQDKAKPVPTKLQDEGKLVPTKLRDEAKLVPTKLQDKAKLVATKIAAWLAFTAVILTAFRTLGAGGDVTESAPKQISIAAAADLKFALDDLVRQFQEKNPATKVNVTYGSSGNFSAQIQNGAPFDLFFSADIGYPQKLAAKGLGADDVFLYAIGRLVVWVPKNSPVAVEKLGMKSLLEPSIHKIAVANPEHAPYGRAAIAALKTLNIYDQVAPRLVYGENIAQTAQFVQSGAADAGLLALSLAVSPQMRNAGRYWQVPLDAYPPMEQGGMILKSSKNLEVARTFRDFVLGDHGRAVLDQYGFNLPGKNP